jgi:hypothetical protein
MNRHKRRVLPYNEEDAAHEAMRHRIRVRHESLIARMDALTLCIERETRAAADAALVAAAAYQQGARGTPAHKGSAKGAAAAFSSLQ